MRGIQLHSAAGAPAACLVLGLTLGLHGRAGAQVTPTSELWREWAVVHRLIEDAREEAERAREAARARRAQRAGAPAAPASKEAPGR